MDNAIGFMISIILLIIIASVISIFFNKKEIMLRELKKTDAKKVKQVKQNEYVKLVGKAIGGDVPFIAPLSGRPCLCYYIVVEEKGRKNSWHTYVEEEQFQDFFLKTEDDLVIIRPSKTHIDFQKTYYVIDYEDKSGFLNDAKPLLEKYLNTFDKDSYGLLGLNKNLRYKEGIIELSEDITVKGVAQWKVLTEPIEDYSNLKILTLTGNSKEKLIITDYPKAAMPI